MTPARRPDVDQRLIAVDIGHLPSINFYARRDVVNAASIDVLALLAEHPLPMIGLLREPDAEAFQARFPGLMEEIGRFPDLYRRGSIVVLMNRQ